MIKEFKGQNRFLSNFYMCPVMFEGEMYPSSEHAYMAAKTTDLEIRKGIASVPTCGEVKRIGRMIELRPGWEDLKYEVMYKIVKDKFTRNIYLREKLLETGDESLMEGNYWGDKVWGVCLKSGEGQNSLGRILMYIRDELRSESDGKG